MIAFKNKRKIFDRDELQLSMIFFFSSNNIFSYIKQHVYFFVIKFHFQKWRRIFVKIVLQFSIIFFFLKHWYF